MAFDTIAASSAVRPPSTAPIAASSARQGRRLRARRRCHGEHSAARWLQDAATPGLRTIAGVQARSALPCGHRGAHLGVDAWPRHEALSCQRHRALRAVCRRCGARQQSHDLRRTVDRPLQTSPQNQPTVPWLTEDAAKQTAVLIATPRTTAPRKGRPAPKMAREALASTRTMLKLCPIGVTDMSPLRI
jgi:hypothetical protein